MNNDLKPNDKLYTWQEVKVSFVIKPPTNIELSRHDCQRINSELLDKIDSCISFKHSRTNNLRCYMNHGLSEDGIFLVKDTPEHFYISVSKDVEVLGYTTYLSANEDIEGKDFYDFEPISGNISNIELEDLNCMLVNLYKIGQYIDLATLKVEIMPFDEVGEERESII